MGDARRGFVLGDGSVALTAVRASLRATIYEHGNGFPAVGAYVTDDERLYRIAEMSSTRIYTGPPGEGNRIEGVLLELCDWSSLDPDEDDTPIHTCGVVVLDAIDETPRAVRLEIDETERGYLRGAHRENFLAGFRAGSARFYSEPVTLELVCKGEIVEIIALTMDDLTRARAQLAEQAEAGVLDAVVFADRAED